MIQESISVQEKIGHLERDYKEKDALLKQINYSLAEMNINVNLMDDQVSWMHSKYLQISKSYSEIKAEVSPVFTIDIL